MVNKLESCELLPKIGKGKEFTDCHKARCDVFVHCSVANPVLAIRCRDAREIGPQPDPSVDQTGSGLEGESGRRR